jgi:cell division protein ZapE
MPYERYRRDLQREGFQHDPAQERASPAFAKNLRSIDCPAGADPRQQQNRVFARWPDATKPPPRRSPCAGLYLWGGVGRGKTYLVDTFVDALPLENKQRIHFHSFMRAVHAELKTLKSQQEPLRIVARRFAEKARVICLDEFFVADITDAMLLYGLLRELFARASP